jgi:hypothetical protein
LFENEFGEPLTETQIVTKIHAIAKKYNLRGAYSINSMRHLLANLLNDKDYSDKQIREVARNMGTSIEVIKRNKTDKKDTGFDVEILNEPKKKSIKKNKKLKLKYIFLIIHTINIFICIYISI